MNKFQITRNPRSNKVRSDGDVIAVSFPRNSELYTTLLDMAHKHKVTRSAMLRQMIQYAVDHMD